MISSTGLDGAQERCMSFPHPEECWSAMMHSSHRQPGYCFDVDNEGTCMTMIWLAYISWCLRGSHMALTHSEIESNDLQRLCCPPEGIQIESIIRCPPVVRNQPIHIAPDIWSGSGEFMSCGYALKSRFLSGRLLQDKGVAASSQDVASEHGASN